MRRARQIGCTATAFALVPGAAAGMNARDAASTGAFLRAEYTKTSAQLNRVNADIEALEAYGARLGRECPGVLNGEPELGSGSARNFSVRAISEERLAAILGVAERRDTKPQRDFVRAIAPLRWSNRSLSSSIHRSTAAELALERLSPPDLCADLKAWVASGYKSVSTATERYVHRSSALNARSTARKRYCISCAATRARPTDPWHGASWHSKAPRKRAACG
jgi:hypothetical protein